MRPSQRVLAACHPLIYNPPLDWLLRHLIGGPLGDAQEEKAMYVGSGIHRVAGLSLLVAGLAAAEEPISRWQASKDPARAVVRVDAEHRSAYPIPATLTGKFAEHLHANILNGMDAQILRNPTFADYPFATGEMSPDGMAWLHNDEARIIRSLRWVAAGAGAPAEALDGLAASWKDGLAGFWSRVGAPGAVLVSPDTGPHGGRAQRVQTRSAGEGVEQWTYLPLHRIRTYTFELYARSPDVSGATLSLMDAQRAHAATARVVGLSPAWQKFTGTLTLPDDSPATPAYRLALTLDAPGQVVIQRLLLYPADHINRADPDVVRLLKAAHLPLLRWPGGNFVSGHRWRDAIGPLEHRPTRANPAWGGAETHHFGTDEFIAFCRAVGCAPMICINAGDGTPEEAAQWIEYCNGPVDSAMGRLRAANGHPEPYRVTHWEVGNELWGRWQCHWTTPAGYVDRYARIAAAMRGADPSIVLYACGTPAFYGPEWNDALIAGAASQMSIITDHPLIGGEVGAQTDPMDVYSDFMAVPVVLEQRWRDLRERMIKGGIASPRLAVTELQLFAKLRGADASAGPARLTRHTLVTPQTMAEAVYDVLIYHAAIRLAPFIEVITHSATVNHGGGLRKVQEKVYADPCYYAQEAFAALAGATPVRVEIESAAEQAPRVLPDLRNVVREASFGSIDVIAAMAPDALWLSMVNRGRSDRPTELTVELNGFDAAGWAEIRALAGEHAFDADRAGEAHPWDANSSSNPHRVQPRDFTVALRAGRLQWSMPSCSVARLRIPRREAQR